MVDETAFEEIELRESFGDFLKRHREASGKTLDAVSRSTRIPKRYLQAFEEGDSSRFPEEAFTKGFLRAYAIEVGLDVEETLQKYEQFKRSLMPTQIKDIRKLQRPPVVHSAPFSFKKSRHLWTAAGALVGLIFLGAVIWAGIKFLPMLKSLAPAPAEETVSQENTEAVVTDEATGSANGEGESVGTNQAEEPAQEEAPVTPSSSLATPVSPSVLSIRANKTVKFSLRLDDNPAHEVEIDANETKIFNVFKEVEIKGADRSALQFQYNGRPLEVAGPSIKLFNRNLFLQSNKP